MTYYIAVQVGVFAIEGSPGSYQIYKSRPDKSYSTLTSENGDTEFVEVDGLENNYPRHLAECLKWVITLNQRSTA